MPCLPIMIGPCGPKTLWTPGIDPLDGDNRMAKCSECGKPAGFIMSVCQECVGKQAKRERERIARVNSQTMAAADYQAVGDADRRPLSPGTSVRAQSPHQPESGSAQACVSLGIIFSAIGIWFLLLSPGEGSAEILGRSVVNLQRLAIGQTSSIVGAIFLAVALRPRR